MKPFKACARRKKLQLPKAPFNMKDFFSKMTESSDTMYFHLDQMLNKNNNEKLHAFIELGGLSKIYEYLNIFYNNNNETQVMRWLTVLNHTHFPIDTELIREMRIGNFIQQIKNKFNCDALTNAIEQKWYRFAKNETTLHQNRNNFKKVRIPDGDLCRKEVVFKKNDKPNKIKKANKIINKKYPTHIPLQSILKSSIPSGNAINSGENIENIPSNINGMNVDDNVHHIIGSQSEYTLEYVGIEEHEDMEMDTDTDTDMDISNDDDIDLMQNGFDDDDDDNNEMQETIEWYAPLLLEIEFIEDAVDTAGMKQEEQRIVNKDEILITVSCVELESSEIVSKECGIIMLTDYPHWSDIEKYRRENE